MPCATTVSPRATRLRSSHVASGKISNQPSTDHDRRLSSCRHIERHIEPFAERCTEVGEGLQVLAIDRLIEARIRAALSWVVIVVAPSKRLKNVGSAFGSARRWTHDHLVDVHAVGLFDGICDRARNGIGREGGSTVPFITSRALTSEIVSASWDSTTPGEMVVTRTVVVSWRSPRRSPHRVLGRAVDRGGRQRPDARRWRRC